MTRGFSIAASALALAAIAFSGFAVGSGCSQPGDESASTASGPERAAARSELRTGAPRLVLLISLDTLRADHLGAYGYEAFTSPVLDELAREGVVFEDASAPAPWTLPSHASILTGLFPLAHRVTSTRTVLPPGVPTLAAMLGGFGYASAAVVNVEWLKKENFWLTRDFQEYLWAPASLSRRSPNTWVSDQALEWIREAKGRPLFVFMHYYDLHSDYKAEPAYEKLFVTPYDGEADGTGWQLKRAILEDDYLAFCHEHFDPERCSFGSKFVIDDKVEKFRFDEAGIRHIEQLYDAQIRQLDTELGRFFAALRSMGVFDDTLVIVTSDHGEEFGEHEGFEHFVSTHQENLRVPLIIRGPGVPAARRVLAPVSSVDIVPTVLSLLDIPIPDGLDGMALSPLWSGGSATPYESRYLYGEASGGISWNFFANGFFPVYQSVRQGRWKLIHESKRNRYLLYDLQSDPGEQVDLAEREPATLARLKKVMDERYASFVPEPDAENAAKLAPEDVERLRALGYVP